MWLEPLRQTEAVLSGVGNQRCSPGSVFEGSLGGGTSCPAQRVESGFNVSTAKCLRAIYTV